MVDSTMPYIVTIEQMVPGEKYAADLYKQQFDTLDVRALVAHMNAAPRTAPAPGSWSAMAAAMKKDIAAQEIPQSEFQAQLRTAGDELAARFEKREAETAGRADPALDPLPKRVRVHGAGALDGTICEVLSQDRHMYEVRSSHGWQHMVEKTSCEVLPDEPAVSKPGRRRIRILPTTSQGKWYSARIGEVFDVSQEILDSYYVGLGSPYRWELVAKSDCEVLP